MGCGKGLPGFDTHDVGIVILSRPVTDRGFAVLPSLGFAGALPMKIEGGSGGPLRAIALVPREAERR